MVRFSDRQQVDSCVKSWGMFPARRLPTICSGSRPSPSAPSSNNWVHPCGRFWLLRLGRNSLVPDHNDMPHNFEPIFYSYLCLVLPARSTMSASILINSWVSVVFLNGNCACILTIDKNEFSNFLNLFSFLRVNRGLSKWSKGLYKRSMNDYTFVP